MTPQEVVGHPDFTNLIKWTIKKKGLKFSGEFEDIVQNIAFRILQYGIGSNLSFSTIIINHTIWHFIENKNQKRRINCQEIIDQKICADNNLKQIDDFDEVQEIFNIVTDRQKEVLKMIMSGKNQIEIGKDLGCAKQNINCVINSARKKIHATIH
jgi:RNA polymerase sigma factor (sigma-70 family)